MTPKPILVIFLNGIGVSDAQLMPLSISRRGGLPTARFAIHFLQKEFGW